MREKIEAVAGAIVRTVVPPVALLDSRLAKWYESSQSHKYQPGDVLVLGHNSFGFGVRPVAVIERYEMTDHGGSYSVTMHTERGSARASFPHEGHFKWNMEFIFRRVRRGMTPEQALELYRGRKAEWGRCLG